MLIFAAGILLATRIYPTLFGSSDVTGHDYIQNLEAISRGLSEKPMNADTRCSPPIPAPEPAWD
ncbi:MAG: hypothetical protein HZB24_00095 [Desulfobacterales bacterium]|nr:hypothetical protein [Desulfobacterales bacterium]